MLSKSHKLLVLPCFERMRLAEMVILPNWYTSFYQIHGSERDIVKMTKIDYDLDMKSIEFVKDINALSDDTEADLGPSFSPGSC